MPFLDVSDLATDPDFADFFNVERRTQTVSSKGRPTISTTTILNQVGVITQARPSDLDRREDYETSTHTIAIVTRFALRMAATGYQPDRVVWNGMTYVVVTVKPYSRFGRGFYKAIAAADTAIEAAQ